jgi:hypothetical protein
VFKLFFLAFCSRFLTAIAQGLSRLLSALFVKHFGMA